MAPNSVASKRTRRRPKPGRRYSLRRHFRSEPICHPKTCNQNYSREQKRSQQDDCRNQQYSIIALTNSAEGIVERYAYSAYGEPVFATGAGVVLTESAKDNRFTYTGREWDEELGLYHFRARMYDAESGRFPSRDPIAFDGSPWNSYEFVAAMPLVFVDPTGLYGTAGPMPWIFPNSISPVDIQSPHDSDNKKCIFLLEPWKDTEFGGLEGLKGPQTYIIRNIKDAAEIAPYIRAIGCCEILILGHQGQSVGNEGGCISKPSHDSTESIIVLPSTDGKAEKEIRDALEFNSCSGCKLFLYTCGGGRRVVQDRNRRTIASRTGCTVYGTRTDPKSITYDSLNDSWCLNPEKWGTAPPGCADFVPWPLHTYPSDNPLNF